MITVQRIKMVLENFKSNRGGDGSFTIYSRVRCTAEDGTSHYFKELLVPKYLRSAFSSKKLNTLYIVDVNKGKSHCLVAYENDIVSKFDPDEIRDIAWGYRRLGLFMAGAGAFVSVPFFFFFFLGAFVFPVSMYFAWVYLVRMPSALNSDKIREGLKATGFNFSRPSVNAAPRAPEPAVL